MLHQLQASKEGFSIKWQHASRAHPKSENCYNNNTPILTPSWNVIKESLIFCYHKLHKIWNMQPIFFLHIYAKFCTKEGADMQPLWIIYSWFFYWCFVSSSNTKCYVPTLEKRASCQSWNWELWGENGRATLVVQLCESDHTEEAIHFRLGRGPAAVCGTGHKRLT